jgi:hypothetical protein
LFLTLLDDKLITLGLYRLRGATDNEYPYVYTNPNFDTVVTHRDRVFVLGVEIPYYLEGDVYHPLDRDMAEDDDSSGVVGHGGNGGRKRRNPSKGQRFHGIQEIKEREDTIFNLKSSKYCKLIT